MEEFAAYSTHIGVEYANEESLQHIYHAHWGSERAYTERLLDELYAQDVPENLHFYIDYEAFSRNLLLDGHYSEGCSESGVFVSS